MKLQFNIEQFSEEFLLDMAERIRVNGRKLKDDERVAFLLSGELPEGAEYPEILDPETWGHGSVTQALLFANVSGGKGVASGPYAVVGPGGMAARQIRGVPKT